jgi:hypothetical protein
MAASVVLRAPASFRRLALAFAIVLALAEIGLFAAAWRLGILIEPAANPRAARLFVVVGSLLTLQAMLIVGIAWTLVALSRAELDADDRVRLEHPWRRWSGAWSEIDRAWWRAGWLAVEVRGEWRRWYVRVPDADAPGLGAVRAALPAGAWLEGPALREYYVRRVVPVFLGAIGVGGLLLLAGLSYLRRL